MGVRVMSNDRRLVLRPQAGGEDVEIRDNMLVGRKEDCDLVVSDGHPSRHHARFSIDADGVTVTDLDSANGTFVNGNRIKGSQRLNNGDAVAFDAARFRFVVEGETPAADDGGATVIRSAADLDRTMIRSAADLRKEMEAPAVAGGAVKPGAWADPSARAGGGTQVFSREELAKMAGEYAKVEDTGSDPYLQVGTGRQSGAVIRLRVGQGTSEWTIGKHADRDIVFQDEGVSDFHAKIVHQGGRWKIADQMSTNGVFINNSKVLAGFLNPGDRIKIGAVECVIVFPGAEAGKGPGPGGGNGIRIAIGVVVLAVALAAAYFLL